MRKVRELGIKVREVKGEGRFFLEGRKKKKKKGNKGDVPQRQLNVLFLNLRSGSRSSSSSSDGKGIGMVDGQETPISMGTVDGGVA